jgi:hypothetical protein
VISPEITVTVDRIGIENGQGGVAFGSVAMGRVAQKVVTIRNTGTAPLTLTPFSTNNVPRGFTITSNIRMTTLRPGASTTFTVAVNTRAAGVLSGRLTILNNDSHNGRFVVPLTATVTNPNSASRPNNGSGGEVTIMDDGQTGFSTTGTWTRATGGGNAGDRMVANKGTGQSVATWQFSGLTPGRYRVSATWVADRTLATNAKYEIHSADRRLGAVTINQERTPASLTVSNVKWQDLGYATITGDSISIKLSNNANDRVMADAIRIEKVSTANTIIRSTSFSLRSPALMPVSEDLGGVDEFSSMEANPEEGSLATSDLSHRKGSESGSRTAVARTISEPIVSRFTPQSSTSGTSLAKPLIAIGLSSNESAVADNRDSDAALHSLAAVLEILETSLDELEPG